MRKSLPFTVEICFTIPGITPVRWSHRKLFIDRMPSSDLSLRSLCQHPDFGEVMFAFLDATYAEATRYFDPAVQPIP